MPPPHGIEALWAYGLPALVALLLLVPGRWAAPVAFTAAIIIGYCTQAGVPKFPPGQYHTPQDNVWGWLPWLAMIAALLGVCDAVFKPRFGPRAAIVALLAAVSMWLLLWPLKATVGPSATAQFLLIALPALTIFLWWISLEKLAVSNPGVTSPVVLLLATVGVAGYLITNQNEMVGYITLSLAAALAMTGLLAIRRPKHGLDRGGVLVCCVFLVTALAVGFVLEMSLTQMPIWPLILVVAAPLLAWAGELPMIRTWRPWRRRAVGLAAVIAAIVIAGILSGRPWYLKNKEFINTQNRPDNSEEM